MARPVIFTISAAWDTEASVWSGHCNHIPADARRPVGQDHRDGARPAAGPPSGYDVRQVLLHIIALRKTVVVGGQDLAEWRRLIQVQTTGLEAVLDNAETKLERIVSAARRLAVCKRCSFVDCAA